MCRAIIFRAVLYESRTWSLTLKAEHGLKVFENKVMWRMFGTKRDKIMGGRRKMHNEELHNFYSLPNIIRMKSMRMRWEGYLARMGEKMNAYKVLVRKLERKRPI
jgi:hypothetical protein